MRTGGSVQHLAGDPEEWGRDFPMGTNGGWSCAYHWQWYPSRVPFAPPWRWSDWGRSEAGETFTSACAGRALNLLVCCVVARYGRPNTTQDPGRDGHKAECSRDYSRPNRAPPVTSVYGDRTYSPPITRLGGWKNEHKATAAIYLVARGSIDEFTIRRRGDNGYDL